MKQVRIHGRGGQGVVTAAEVLSVAAFHKGLHAQAFPSFGSERMGAPVVAFCRVDHKPIQLREPIAEPDVVIVQDPTLLQQVDVFGGLAGDGIVLINSARTPQQLNLQKLLARLPSGHVRTVPATDIARQHVGRPLPNAAMLGALAGLVDWIDLESIARGIRGKFPTVVADKNIAAARAAAEAMAGAIAPAAA